ncbi:MAG: hypothetical protein ABSC64_02365 [Candidatus Korobacteraceae bacterium]
MKIDENGCYVDEQSQIDNLERRVKALEENLKRVNAQLDKPIKDLK